MRVLDKCHYPLYANSIIFLSAVSIDIFAKYGYLGLIFLLPDADYSLWY